MEQKQEDMEVIAPEETAKYVKKTQPQGDLFLCDVSDATFKDIMPTMEHPFYTLSKNKDSTPRHYKHGENSVEITPSVLGLATIWDKDLLIYAISQLTDALNKGEEIDKTVRINSIDFLKFTHRGTGGRDYKALVLTLKRLQGTLITTNIKTGGILETRNFGLINESVIKRVGDDEDGRILYVDITLSDWVYNAITARSVLTLDRKYFTLKKSIDRRLYELARKHNATYSGWPIGLDKLHLKVGTNVPLRRFRHMLKEISRLDHLPQYSLSISDKDVVTFKKKRIAPKNGWIGGPLPQEAHEAGRAVAPGRDIHALENEWRVWISNGEMKIRNPTAHFVKFCKNKGPLKR